jgi:hypothetical protein
MKKVSLSPGVVVEEVGNGVLVMVPGSQDVVSLSGRAAEVVRSVQSGFSVVDDSLVAELAGLGVVEVSGISRRGLIKTGAIGAGAGIAVLAMPGVAAASSGPTGDSGSTGDSGPTSDDAIGYLFGFQWDTTLSPILPDLFPEAVGMVGPGAINGDWVATIFLVDPPYDPTVENLTPRPTGGLVTVGNKTYPAFLQPVFEPDEDDPTDPALIFFSTLAWVFNSKADQVSFDSGWVLTFDFGGESYRFVQGPL